MTLGELHKIIDAQISHHPEARAWQVVIPNNKPSVGPRACTLVTQAIGGIDWDKGKFFLFTEFKMQELQNVITNADIEITEEGEVKHILTIKKID